MQLVLTAITQRSTGYRCHPLLLIATAAPLLNAYAPHCPCHSCSPNTLHSFLALHAHPPLSPPPSNSPPPPPVQLPLCATLQPSPLPQLENPRPHATTKHFWPPCPLTAARNPDPNPQVVQTFVVKVAVLDDKAIRPLDVSAANSGSLAVLYPQTQCVGAWTAQRSSHLGGGMNSMRLTRGSTACSQSAATAAAAAAALGCSGPLPPQHADSQATGSATGSSRNGTSTGGRGGSGGGSAGGSGGAAGPKLQPRGTSTCGGGTASTGGAQANSSDLQRQVVSRADSFNSDDG